MKPDHPNGQPVTAPRPAGLDATIRRMRSQTPQESLGLPDGTGLAKPFLLATVVIAVALAALTAGPYFYDKARGTTADNKPAPADKPEAKPDQPQPNASPTPAPVTPGPDASAKQPPTTPAGPSKGPAPKDDILDKLGESGSKTASPKVNPLDKKNDDLLNDIK